MSRTPTLRIALLGSPLIEVDEKPFAVDTRKATALLAYLAISGRPAGRDVLAGLLWPEADPDRARSALRRTLSTLRTALGDRWLTTDRDSVALTGDGVWLDVTELRGLLAACATHGHGPGETCRRCLPLLEEAVALDRGVFLAGFGLRDSAEFDDWQQLVSGELRREQAGALARLAEVLALSGDAPRALAIAHRRLALEPLHEPAHRQVIHLYALTGDRSSALEHYRECVRILDRELGVRPLDETTALYHAILEGTHASAAPPQTAREPDATRDERHALVGRVQELSTLREALAAVGRDGRLLSVVGEAGIGKTRLCDELADTARAEGVSVISVRCFQEERELAFGLVIGLVRAALDAESDVGDAMAAAWWRPEVARLLPELGPPPASALDNVAAQARFYEAICALLTDRLTAGRGLLVVDDLHWADDASLGLLGYLANRLRGRPLLIVATWRPEEISASHTIHRLLADARRGRTADVVVLGRLSAGDIGSLVRHAGQDESITPQLHRESGGLPFFVVEYLDALARGEDPSGDWPMPGGVKELLGSRLSGLGELARQVIAAAAVLGRSFDAETVRVASGRTDEETVSALEDLLARGLLTEAVDGGFDFRHEQARELVVDGMTLARRRLLHRRAADALAVRGRRDEQAALVAHHLALAGDEEAAAASYRTAGDRARRLFANVEATSHYRAALALGDPHVVELQTALGDLETLAGDYGAALAAYETAAANAPDELLAPIEHRLGLLSLRRGAWDLADAELASALERLPREDAARALADRSLVAHRRGDAARASALAWEALVLAEETGDRRALAQAHNILGMLATAAERHDEAVAQVEQSLVLAREAGDREAEAAALNNLALAVARQGRSDEAIVLTTAALRLCVSLGDRHREAALRNNLADLLHTTGREDEAMTELKQAVALFAEIGEPGKLEPEIWKLSEW